jgi:hypothetical protein
MIKRDTNRVLISLRLSRLALQILQAMAEAQGISRTAVLEIMIRKQAEEVEESMPAVYGVLHGPE